jgi:hypothetical protein
MTYLIYPFLNHQQLAIGKFSRLLPSFNSIVSFTMPADVRVLAKKGNLKTVSPILAQMYE